MDPTHQHYGNRLHIDTRAAAGRLVLNVPGSVAQWEREAIGERTKDALTHEKAQGHKTGGDVPYGYCLGGDGKTLVADAAEQTMLASIRDAHSRGLSQRAVVAELAQQGFTTRQGTALGLTQVQRIMQQAQIAWKVKIWRTAKMSEKLGAGFGSAWRRSASSTRT